MLTSAPKKTGRPMSVHKTAKGDQVAGLMRLKDGRWRASGPEKFTFSEADEELAVLRFREWKAGKQQAVVRVPQAAARLDDAEGVRQAVMSMPQSEARLHEMTGTYLPPGFKPEPSTAPPPSPIRLEVDGDHLLFFRDPTNANAFWPWLRKLILEKPKYVAQQTGIEQLGYLSELPKPTPSPTMDDLIALYAAKPSLSKDEVARVKRYWLEFANLVGIETIRELEVAHVESYESKMAGSEYSPKSIKHRYTGIRTVIAYSMKRGKGTADCRRALDRLAMLQVNNVHTLDPKPIRPADFWAIHAAAVKARDKTFAALMLLSLNAALYSSEAGAVRWSDVDLERGEFVTRRAKTQVPRVAILWPETVKALKALPRPDDRQAVFCTSRMAYARQSVHREWTAYRVAAKVKDGVTFSMIRDAAFTHACRVSLDQARVLAGHRVAGSADHYLMRSPGFVADACRAIREEFYGKRGRP